MEKLKGPIGLFDSGYGGLTILKEIRAALPQYDYVYLGDNARTPYGTRSFEVVYRYTRQAVKKLFEWGCPLVVLACNTASAKALRTIQQVDLPCWDPSRRVLGVIRPSVEALADYSRNRHIGILATKGTVASESYPLEIEKLYGRGYFRTTQIACPMWVPLVENNELEGEGTAYFVKKYAAELFMADPEIDTIILGCTHYPLLRELIAQNMPPDVTLIEQGPIVADRLKDYLLRHPDLEKRMEENGKIRYLTTEKTGLFDRMAGMFMGENLTSEQVEL